MFHVEKNIDSKIEMLSITKVAVMAKTASHVVVVTAVVDLDVLYIASMNRTEMSKQCVCCDRMTACQLMESRGD